MPVVRVMPQEVELSIGEGRRRTLLEILADNSVLIESECAGEGTCGKCLVELVSGALVDTAGNPASPEFDMRYLACQCYPLGDCEVRVASGARDEKELDEFIAGSIGVVEGIDGVAGNLGLAVDIGTTTVVALLADLDTRVPLAVESETNPQRAYGADVISRIAFSTAEGDGRGGTAVLQEAAVGCINRLVERLCDKSGQPRDRISSAVCVGNTSMQHFLLRITPEHLGMAPYEAEFKEVEPRPATEIGLELPRGATLTVLPNIGSFIGADTVACLLSIENSEPAGYSMMVDMGTNTEMVLSRGEQRVACSAAAGPAFEGAHIKHGMRATPGAIRGMRLEHGDLVCETVAGEPPVGICGSGIVDAIAALRRLGAVEANGRMPEFTEFVLVEAAHTGTGRDITITRNDIREIQLVKASIATGMKFLLEHFGVALDQVQKLYVAGAFGNYLDIANARYIGLLPDLPPDRFSPIGDAALKGALTCLVEGSPASKTARAIAYGTEHLELANKPDFQKRFLRSMNLERYRPHD